MTDTATVETLTAEVRVLMVGNRQVTLSVARQLDTVDLADLEPFGRVRVDQVGIPSIVGRSKETGALVLASYRATFGLPWIDQLSGKITVCEAMRPVKGDYPLDFRGRSIVVSREDVQKCGTKEHLWSDLRCNGWSTNGLDDEIEALIAEADATKARHKAAAALPLIVLAGLR